MPTFQTVVHITMKKIQIKIKYEGP
jgi:hypothetical protein